MNEIVLENSFEKRERRKVNGSWNVKEHNFLFPFWKDHMR